jgi:hypothetical protein
VSILGRAAKSAHIHRSTCGTEQLEPVMIAESVER